MSILTRINHRELVYGPFISHLRSHELAAPNLRAGRNVRVWLHIVQVNQNTRVIGLVCTRKGDEGTRRSTAATGDLDLGAGQVELSATGAVGHVQRDLVDAEQVLATRGASGNLRGHQLIIIYPRF